MAFVNAAIKERNQMNKTNKNSMSFTSISTMLGSNMAYSSNLIDWGTYLWSLSPFAKVFWGCSGLEVIEVFS